MKLRFLLMWFVTSVTRALINRTPFRRLVIPGIVHSIDHVISATPRISSIATMATASDTIFALSSGPLTKTGVAVIRISGPAAKLCLEELLESKVSINESKKPQSFPETRRASLRYLYCPKTHDILDHALVLWFPGPRSFTGEDIVELHCHGGRAVILGVFGALEYLDDVVVGANNRNQLAADSGGGGGTRRGKGIRPADRGEFTRRAFDNGRMDLTEVEGLADLLAADTSEQRKQALRQMDGYLRQYFERWREELLNCLAHTEAVIDFGDDDREDDVNDSAMYALIPRVRVLQEELMSHLQDGRKGELVRDGVKIALAGPPNAGKSSLMNALARRPAAIVSPIAGTTRDVVEVRMDLGGIPCIISDTAGLRVDSVDPIEQEGIKRAKNAFKEAQIKLFVGDASDQASLREAEQMLGSLLQELHKEEDEDEEEENEDEEEGDDVTGASSGGGEDAFISIEHDIVSKRKRTATGSGSGSGLGSTRNPYRVLTVLNKADLTTTTTTTATLTSTNLLTSPGPSAGATVAIPSIHTAPSSSSSFSSFSGDPSRGSYVISCATGVGMGELETAITNAIRSLLEDGGGGGGGGGGTSISGGGSGSGMNIEGVLITRERHRRHLKQCVEHLDAFLSSRLPMDAAAEELRLAMLELGRVTGRVDVEELLDIIFRDFCIGK